jgi:hypothetical protein
MPSGSPCSITSPSSNLGDGRAGPCARQYAPSALCPLPHASRPIATRRTALLCRRPTSRSRGIQAGRTSRAPRDDREGAVGAAGGRSTTGSKPPTAATRDGPNVESIYARIDQADVPQAKELMKSNGDRRAGLSIRRSLAQAQVGGPRIRCVGCARTDGPNCGTRHQGFPRLLQRRSQRKAQRSSPWRCA